MFPMTITLNTQEQLVAVLAAMHAVQQEAAERPTLRGRMKPEIRDPETSPAAASVAAPASAATTPTTPSQSAASRSDVAQVLPVDRPTVSNAIVKLAARNKVKALEILGQFGAKAGKEVQNDDLAACYALVLAALED
jgi:hypothetical protein